MELHIGYLRSLEDSERVRAACVQFLQNWLLVFHPEMPHIVERAQALARSLGGELVRPGVVLEIRLDQRNVRVEAG